MNVNDETIPAPPPPPPPPQGGQPARRLTRSTDDKVLTGLCGGLGQFFGVDPVIFRIAFVVLALAGGTGILLYLAGWLLIPDDQGVTEADKLVRTRSQNVALAVLVVLGTCLLLAGFADDDRADFPLALILIAIGAVAIWSRQQGGADSVGPSVPPTATPPSSTSGVTVSDAVPGTSAAATAPTRPVDAPPPPPVPPGPRSVLVPVTLSLLLVLAGVLALLGVSLVTGLALALLVTGVALVIGAWWGRGRGLIPVALVLTGALATASFMDVPLEGGIGDRIHQPQTLAELRSPYRLGVGELELDLSDLDLGGRTVDVVVSTGIGHIQVIVPNSVPVLVTGRAGLGEVDIFGSTWGGTGIERRVTRGGREGSGRLVLRARVGIGEVEVLRAAA